VIVDDHELLRMGTRQILSEAEGMEVVAEAADAAEAIAVVDATQPDIVLIDIRLPDRNGIDVARLILERHPSIRVVILSAYDDDDYVRAAIDLGVAGYLLKTMPGDELVRAVRASSATTVLDSAVTARLGRDHRNPGTAHKGTFSALTWREQEVVDLVAKGLSNKTIAARLNISTRTVEGHLNHVFVKLGVGSRTELVRLALAGRDQWPIEERGTNEPEAGVRQ
jgi:two-component system, NarL family, response regulator DevR